MSPELSKVADLYAECLDWRHRITRAKSEAERLVMAKVCTLFILECVAAIDAADEAFGGEWPGDEFERPVAAEIRAALAEMGAPSYD